MTANCLFLLSWQPAKRNELDKHTSGRGIEMIIRVLTGGALLLLGYYIGREVGRTEPIRKELKEAREKDKETPKGKEPKPAPKQ